MAQAKGANAQVLIDFETTYGADPVSVNGISVPFNYPFDLKVQGKLEEGNTHRGVRDAAMPFDGNLDVKGSPVIPVDQIAIGYWLRALLGPPVTTGGPTYTHVFVVDPAIPSMVVEAGWTDVAKYLKFNGVKVSKLGMEIKPEGELVAKLELVGAKETAGATSYDATPQALVFSRFLQRQATLEEGGATIAYVQEVDFEIDNNLDDGSFMVGGGGIRGDLPEGDCKVSGRIKAFFQDLTLYNKAVNGTESSLKIILTSGTYSLTLFFAELRYQRVSPIIVKGGAYVEMPFMAYYENHADAAVFKATLINGHAAYV